MGYSVNFSALGKSFVMPSIVAEKLKMANEAQIKTAVWIFSHMGENIDPEIIAKSTGKPTAAVEEALLYWASVDVLVSDGANAALSSAAQPPQSQKALPEIPDIRPSYEQVIKRCQESPETDAFMKELQTLLGKTVGYDGQSTFLMMHDSYGLPFEVIYMLVNYCVASGKASYRYMAKMARSWGEKEIDTIEKADEEISKLDICSKAWTQFAAMTGIKTPKPTAFQQTLLLKWINDYKFSMDMIYEAYEYMAENCAKISFKYMDAVLTNWFENGIKDPEDIKKYNETKKQEKNKPAPSGNKKSSYDMDEFEQRANQLPVYKSGKGAAQ